MATNQPLEYEQAGYNAPDGVQVGKATTEKVGFYGTAPVVQPSITAVATTTATTTLNKTKIDRLYTALVSLGIVVSV